MSFVFFRDVWNLVLKNFKLLIRSKASSLVVVLGPLLIIFLAGIAFDNSNLYNLRVGAFSPSKNSVVSSFYDVLSDKFVFTEFSSKDDCVGAVKSGDVHTCVVFHENFTIGKIPNNEIDFFVDFSRINLVWTVMNVMTENVGREITELSQNLTSVLLDTLEFTKSKVQEERLALVRLSTENDVISKNVASLSADLSDFDLSFNPADFVSSNLSSYKNKVKHWVDTSISLSEEALVKAGSLAGYAKNIIETSGGSVPDAVLESFKDSLNKFDELKKRISTSKDLSQQEFAGFDSAFQSLVSQLQETKSRLDDVDVSRQLGIRILDAVRALLDKSLIGILEVQNALNLIEERIDAIAIKDPKAVSQPIVTSVKPVSAKRSYLNYLFPTLIVLVMMFTAFFVSSALVMLEKKSPALFRNFMTPVSDFSFFVSILVTSFSIIAVQLIIILSISGVFFSSQVIGNFFPTLLVLVLSGLFFVFLGMFIGYLFNSEATSILACVSLGALFLFLSDIIIPIESMPLWFSKIAQFNPLVLSSGLIRKTLLFDASLSGIWLGLLVLVLFTLLAFALAVIVFLLFKQRISVSGFFKIFKRRLKKAKPKDFKR
ncbi:hypothetical protein DRJ22_00300 [Candidatus Woesearchaeota archaeon]|nr:MAG: hypothetical protein DRJ22_00300 [Candidatus Woesearchaeota archaeon]